MYIALKIHPLCPCCSFVPISALALLKRFHLASGLISRKKDREEKVRAERERERERKRERERESEREAEGRSSLAVVSWAGDASRLGLRRTEEPCGVPVQQRHLVRDQGSQALKIQPPTPSSMHSRCNE